MKRLFKIRRFGKPSTEEEDIFEEDEDYVELDVAGEGQGEKIIVKTYLLEDFSDVKPILDDLREGYTIAIVNIKPLRDRDIVELKRAINKLKKTIDVIGGDIAGLGEDYVILTPSFAEISRESSEKENNIDL